MCEEILMTSQNHKEIVEQFDALLGSDDLGRLDELCTPRQAPRTTPSLRTGPQDSPAPESS